MDIMSLAPHGGTLVNRVDESYDVSGIQKKLNLI